MKWGWECQEFVEECVKFEMPTSQSSGGFKGTVMQESRLSGEGQVRDFNLKTRGGAWGLLTFMRER